MYYFFSKLSQRGFIFLLLLIRQNVWFHRIRLKMHELYIHIYNMYVKKKFIGSCIRYLYTVYMHGIHGVYVSNTRCIQVKYNVYISHLQKTDYVKTPKVVLQLSGFTIHLVSLKNGDALCLIGYKTNHIDDVYFTTTFRPCQK